MLFLNLKYKKIARTYKSIAIDIVLAGTAYGLALGILPALEGTMSGMMSGMMGAMLWEMIAQNQSVIMINIFLTLSVSSLLLFQISPNPYEKRRIL
ncbi:hypothetical protein [Niallia sp. 01092]|uniref:hypothetical protein n=1 Tax=unclassified Niallia TaxID=2837522 RepID=UPI003FD51352